MEELLQQITRWIFPLTSIILIVVAATRRNLPGKLWFIAYLVIGLITMLAWRIPSVLGRLETLDFDISRFYELFSLPLNILGFVGFCMLFPFLFAVSGSPHSSVSYDHSGKSVDEHSGASNDSLQHGASETKNSIFSFDGRIKRGTFWATIAPLFLISFVLQIAMAASKNNEGVIGIAVIAIIFFIPAIWVAIATFVNRWHDLYMSGWMVLIMLIPFVNILVILYLGIAPGSEGANKFGEEPV